MAGAPHLKIEMWSPGSDGRKRQITSGQRFEDQLACGLDFLGQDGMGAAGITLRVHFRAHRSELLRRGEDTTPGYMRVRISGTKERRHSREIARMVQIRVRGPNEAAGQCHQAAIARRMAGNKFRRQASALREATEKNALQRYAAIHGELYHRTHLCQGGG